MIEVTPSGVVVQVTEHASIYPMDGRAQGRSKGDLVDWDSWDDIAHNSLSPVLRFNNDGEGCDGLGTFECGPWRIDGILD